MRVRWVGYAIAAFAASPAWAEAPVVLSLDLGAVSDYRFRGVSLSGRDPAIQGEVSAEHETGAHLALWGSTIAKTSGGADLELDFEGGWLFELSPLLSVDISAIYYVYPGDSAANYVEPALTGFYKVGPATTRIGLAYIPKQGATRNAAGRMRDNAYAYVGIELPIKGTSVTLDGQIGYERGAFDFAPRGGKWDWQLGARADVKGLSLELAYIDGAVRGGADEAEPTVVGSVLFGF
jgi:uncharacterized protein (TIGR02001 family)